MANDILIKIGGIFHLICALSHLFFPKVFKWEDNLRELSKIKQKKIKQMLYISNTSTMMFWLILSYIPFFFSNELITTQLGKSILTGIVFFWIIRIFLIQTIIVGIKTKESWQRIIFFMIGFIFFFIPWIRFFL
jgi:hypothetical protein